MLIKILQILIYSIVPLVGILNFGWDWRQVIILYWLENIAVGIATFIAIVSAPAGTRATERGTTRGSRLEINGRMIDIASPVGKMAYAGFFAVHYGGFTFIHGLFVFALVSGAFSFGNQSGAGSEGLPDIGGLLITWLGMTVVQLVVLWQKRMDKAAPSSSLAGMFATPYKRIVALHLAIIFGAFTITALNLPSAAAIILIAVHAITDLSSFRTKTN